MERPKELSADEITRFRKLWADRYAGPISALPKVRRHRSMMTLFLEWIQSKL